MSPGLDCMGASYCSRAVLGSRIGIAVILVDEVGGLNASINPVTIF